MLVWFAVELIRQWGLGVVRIWLLVVAACLLMLLCILVSRRKSVERAASRLKGHRAPSRAVRSTCSEPVLAPSPLAVVPVARSEGLTISDVAVGVCAGLWLFVGTLLMLSAVVAILGVTWIRLSGR